MKLAAPRRTSLALILFACGVMGSARADDPPPSAQVTTPASQKGGAGQKSSMPSAADRHRLPPDSSTRHSLEQLHLVPNHRVAEGLVGSRHLLSLHQRRRPRFLPGRVRRRAISSGSSP
ncbi:hypothetical protein ACVWY5_001076 [Bradyrhizobium sp. USDA 3256]